MITKVSRDPPEIRPRCSRHTQTLGKRQSQPQSSVLTGKRCVWGKQSEGVQQAELGMTQISSVPKQGPASS